MHNQTGIVLHQKDIAAAAEP